MVSLNTVLPANIQQPIFFSHAAAQLFEALLYKPEGRGFDYLGVI